MVSTKCALHSIIINFFHKRNCYEVILQLQNVLFHYYSSKAHSTTTIRICKIGKLDNDLLLVCDQCALLVQFVNSSYRRYDLQRIVLPLAMAPRIFNTFL